MALYPPRIPWYGVRGRTLPFPYIAPHRVPLPPARHHDAHSQRPLRVEYQGKSHLVHRVLYRSLLNAMLDLHQLHKLCVISSGGVSDCILNVFTDHEELWQPAWGVRTGEGLLRPIVGSFALGSLTLLLHQLLLVSKASSPSKELLQ